MFKERIVKFSDGTYGIQVRGGWFKKPKFLWLGDNSLSCYMEEGSFRSYCKSSNLERVKECFDQYNLTFAPLETNLADHM